MAAHPLINTGELSLFNLVTAMCASKETTMPREPARQLNLLIMEEGESIATATAHGLRHRGFAVRDASSYLRGLELYKSISAEIDIVVIDATSDPLTTRYAIHLTRHINPRADICLLANTSIKRQVMDLLDASTPCVLEKPLPHIDAIADHLWQLASMTIFSRLTKKAR